MITSVIYPTYRAIERPIHFKGFAGPYIFLAAVSLIGDLLLFVILYVCHLPPWMCVSMAFGLGALSLIILRRLSQRFGGRGLEQYLAARSLPRSIRFQRRTNFYLHQYLNYGKEK